MKSILYDLYHGLYSASERSFSDDSDYGRAFARLVELEKELLERLGETEKRLFLEYNSVSSDMDAFTGECGFEEGFRLGVRLMIESMAG